MDWLDDIMNFFTQTPVPGTIIKISGYDNNVPFVVPVADNQDSFSANIWIDDKGQNNNGKEELNKNCN